MMPRQINPLRTDTLIVPRRPHMSKRFGAKDRPLLFGHDIERWWRYPNTQGRDSMKQKCYDAEDEVRRQIEQVKFATHMEMAEYVQDTMEAEWFQQRWPYFTECLVVKKETRDGHCLGGPRATFDDPFTKTKHVSVGRIQMSHWGMGLADPWDGGEMIVLHELAHAVCLKGEKHGRLWACSFVEMVTHRLGEDIGALLKSAFERYRIPMGPRNWRDETTKLHMAQLSACPKSEVKVEEAWF